MIVSHESRDNEFKSVAETDRQKENIERGPRPMKNALRVIAIVVVAALLFGAGFGLGSKKGITVKLEVVGSNGATVNTDTPVNNDTPATQPATQPAATDPAPTEPAATEPAATEPAATEPAATEPAANGDSKLPSSTEEIVAKYNEVINATKKMQNGTMHKTSDTSIEVTELSVSFLKSAVNGIVSGLIKPSDDTWTFTNGAAEDGKTPSDAITPGGRDVALQAAGVKSATCTPDGDGYKIAIVLVEEKSTFDGTNTTNPVHHESCLSPLNLATLDISPAKITSADMTYPGATLNVTVDGQGRVTHYDFKLPMSGKGAGSMGPTLELGLAGEMVEVYDITY